MSESRDQLPPDPLAAPFHVAKRGGAAAEALAPGERLAGRYRIVRLLGQGGMGRVYEAEDCELGERIALKTLRAEAAADERARARFKREIQLARRVTHRNVCRIFDVAIDRGGEEHAELVFLTMELLAGESLADLIRRRGPLGEREALPIARQIAAALAAAHAAGVVHRDLKSSNVIVTDAGGRPRATVTDFGLARTDQAGSADEASLTGPGEMIGSPPYMAPEQVEGGAVTPRTDVYALGVVLYELVTGTWPFVGRSPLQTAVKRLKEAPVSPCAHVPTLSRRWEAAILRCLERDPARRFASADEVVRALERGAWRRGRAAWLAAAGLAVALVLVLVGFGPGRGLAPPAATALPARHAETRAPQAITVRLLAEPADARWIVDGERLDCNPCQIRGQSGARRVAIVGAPGYVSKTVEIRFDRDHDETAELARMAPTPAPAPVGTAKKPVASRPVPRRRTHQRLTIDKTMPSE
jgi:tRNA A-37 threonylcarbamoyl transferase component Bud32